MTFSADAEVPESWECRTAAPRRPSLVDVGKPVGSTARASKVPRTHWDMLLERRTLAELEELLEERLSLPARPPRRSRRRRRSTRSALDARSLAACTVAARCTSRAATSAAATTQPRSANGYPTARRGRPTGSRPSRSSDVGDHRARLVGGKPHRSCARSGSITWLVPTVEMFTTDRPVSIARMRANASCCRFSSVPRKSALFVWNM